MCIDNLGYFINPEKQKTKDTFILPCDPSGHGFFIICWHKGSQKSQKVTCLVPGISCCFSNWEVSLWLRGFVFLEVCVSLMKVISHGQTFWLITRTACLHWSMQICFDSINEVRLMAVMLGWATNNCTMCVCVFDCCVCTASWINNACKCLEGGCENVYLDFDSL